MLRLAAGAIAPDGDLESLDADFYSRLRPLLLAIAAWLFALGGLSVRARRTGNPAWSRWARGLAAGGVLALVFAAGNLAGVLPRLSVSRYLIGEIVRERPQPEAPPTPSVPAPGPSGPGTWELVDAGTDVPTVLTHAGDGSDRVFVAFQPGQIVIYRDGVPQETPFLDLRDRVIQERVSYEQGLLGLAFHPDFTENGYFYVNYVDPDGDTVVSRFQVFENDPDRADPDSELRLFGLLQPAEIHNGGQMAFGPDGYLYIATGDGGPQGDPFGTAQSLDTLLGKLLRIDVDTGDPYGIPPGNPFAAGPGRDEIYGYGLRNPWRFSFDPLTGDLFIGDVGHNLFEEINYIPAGSPPGFNLGWSHFEGFYPYEIQNIPPVGYRPDYTAPIWVLGQSDGGPCAVIGGYVYRGSLFPALYGLYIYGDLCTGAIWGLYPGAAGGWENVLLYDTEVRITSFGLDAAGELYLLTLQGEIFRLAP